MLSNDPADYYDREWNMAERFYTRLDKRLDECAISSTQFDYMSWYRTLREVYRMIKRKIEKSGVEKIDELFSKAKIQIQNLSLNKNKPIVSATISNLEIILDELHLELSNKLFDNNLILPKKLNLTFEEEVTKDYA